jgi:hypothetical protein
MPVIDETIITKEIKEFKAEVRTLLEDFKKRLESLEKPKSGK